MSRRILIGFRDWMQQSAASLSGGVWNQSLANMLDPRPQLVAEAADNRDPGSTRFDFDLGRQCTVGLIWFANLRATSMGFIDIKAGTDPTFASNAYETATTCWPQDSTAGEFNGWGQWTLNGVYLAETYGWLGMPRFFIPPATIQCRYGRVEIRDPCAAEPLQIGCFGVSEVWEPPINFDYGWQITAMDESVIERVPGGTAYVDERGMRRRLNLGFGQIAESEVWARGFDLSLVKGRRQPLVVLPYSDSTEAAQTEKAGMYGRVSQDSALSNPFFQRFQHPFQIDQDI